MGLNWGQTWLIWLRASLVKGIAKEKIARFIRIFLGKSVVWFREGAQIVATFLGPILI
jgi:hypothetical protein